ncbi:sodium-dependent dicarboxylate transporter 2/3/5 [Caldalkalibacillus uzonensis]|uniref:Sodium-dependent dicarboxylate transporter SdcS n=1 Tax=Caldalkalibacillus uzonensis TaxID=353224 RepID=A0ABU0CRG9_9BACI|nr:DASS family sodium-coupled anion symporter [Caldalkalibacillus uzonensis]MDQ0338100.1 sodium-dependent dicarboxylate transporter 2/3/5 [Caldalkalibacillus uzonensis]
MSVMLQVNRKITIFFLLNISSFLLFFLIPTEHAKMLVVLVFALTGWGMRALPQPLISLSIILYIAIMGIHSFNDALTGFGQPFVWLLLSTFVLAAAFEKTGLGKRIALFLLRQVGGRLPSALLSVFLAMIILSFFIPTAAGRVAMLIPVCLGLIQVVHAYERSSNFAKTMLMGVAFTSSFMSWAIITGSSSTIYAASTLHMMTGFQWTYFYWFVLNFPIVVILTLTLWFIGSLLYPVNKHAIPESAAYIEAEWKKMGGIKGEEFKILVMLVVTLSGWMTESYHGFSVPMVAMLSAIVTCLPKLGVQTWKEASHHIDWDVLILFGAAYTLAEALQSNGTAAWIAVTIGESLSEVSPLGAALLLISLTGLFRLGFANMLGITAVFLPITISLAELWRINPVWLSQLVIIACSFSYFLPTQSPGNLITFSYGYYRESDLAKMGLVLFSVIVPVLLLSAFLYWPLMGLKP